MNSLQGLVPLLILEPNSVAEPIKNEPDHQSHIRRIEDGKWYWLEKAIIREYAPKVGVLGIAVYNYLASLANAKQFCFPSQRRIGEVIGYSRTSVSRAIKKLEKHGLIRIDRSGIYHQTYTLLKVSCDTEEIQV
jgi:biotin operon repressor